jgi:hypothetical protein
MFDAEHKLALLLEQHPVEGFREFIAVHAAVAPSDQLPSPLVDGCNTGLGWNRLPRHVAPDIAPTRRATARQSDLCAGRRISIFEYEGGG